VSQITLTYENLKKKLQTIRKIYFFEKPRQIFPLKWVFMDFLTNTHPKKPTGWVGKWVVGANLA
jgi:hypothetical protein